LLGGSVQVNGSDPDPLSKDPTSIVHRACAA
jgi:hypothetical protein